MVFLCQNPIEFLVRPGVEVSFPEGSPKLLNVGHDLDR